MPVTAKEESRYTDLTRLLELFSSEETAPNVLYLGDSVVERTSKHDSDARTLGKMLADCLHDKLSVASISGSAYHMQVFLGFVQILSTLRLQPKMLVLPINLRSFSPQWDLNPLWRLEPEIAAIKSYLAEPHRGSPVLEKADQNKLVDAIDSYANRVVEYPLSEFSQIGQFREVIASNPQDETEKNCRWRHIYIFHYTHPLDCSHPKLGVLTEIINQLADMGIKILLYITPINYCAGLRHVGSEFEAIVRENIRVITNCIDQHTSLDSTRLLDYSTLLTSDYFFHDNDPTEHLNQAGRSALANSLADQVLDLQAAEQ
ncbi:hypothetical protein [Synechococcus sp. CCY 0621]|uniref:hypothetical protein n=1 Tax=Synechococcus sp. CCY 0621 TaxID=2815603 RepID=UPI001C2490BA|nr:hypothetical protein [Synechococcus sp. CCY 0621]